MEPKAIVELHAHFRHPTDEQLGHVDIFLSNYYNLQSVYFELNIGRSPCWGTWFKLRYRWTCGNYGNVSHTNGVKLQWGKVTLPKVCARCWMKERSVIALITHNCLT